MKEKEEEEEEDEKQQLYRAQILHNNNQFFALITIYQISTQFHARNPDCQITLQQEAMTKKETIIDFPEST
jgi:hypothetical protein